MYKRTVKPVMTYAVKTKVASTKIAQMNTAKRYKERNPEQQLEIESGMKI